MITVGDLLAVLRMRDEMTPVANNAIGTLGNLGGAAGMTSYQLTLLGRGMREAGVLATGMFTVPIMGAATAAVKFGSDFESVTSKLVSLAGVQQDELEMVKKKILDLAPAVGIGPVALAEGMYAVSSTVADTSVALDILERSAKLSAAGLGEVNVVGRALTTVINSYGSENITASRAADVLTRAIRDGGAEASALAPVLANVVPFAAKMGVSLEQVAANFVVVTKAGVPAGEAITMLTSVFAALTRETPRGEAALKSVGLSYAAIKKEIREDGLEAALLHLKTAFEGNDKGLFNVLGRLEALKNLLAVTGEQAGTYTAEVQRMAEAQGEADQAFEAAAKTLEFKWNQLVTSLQVVAVTLGEALLPIIKDVVDFINANFMPVLKFLVDVFRDMPTGVQVGVLAILGFVAILGPAMIIFGQFIMAVGNIARAFGLLTAGSAASGMTGLVTFLTSSMWVVAAGWIAGIATAIGLVWIAWKIGNTETVKNSLAEWALSADNLTAMLYRAVAGVEKMTPEAAKAAVAATAAAEAQSKHNESIKTATASLQDIMKPMASHGKSVDDATEAARKAALANQTLLEKVRALTSEQRASIDAFKAAGLTVHQISEETGIAANVIGVYERQVNKAGSTAKKAATDMRPFLEAMEELNSSGTGWIGTLDTIDGAVVEAVKYYLAAGVSQGALAKAYDLTATQVKAVASSLKAETDATTKATAEAKKHADAMEELNSTGTGWIGTLDTMDGAVVEAIKYYLEAGVSQGNLATAYDLTGAQIKAVASLLAKETAATREATAAKERYAKAVEEVNSVGVGWQGTLDTIDGAVVEGVKHYIQAGVALSVLATYYGLTDAQVRAVSQSMKKETDDYGNSLRLLSSEFTKLGQIAGGSLGAVFKGVGQMVVQLEAAHKITEQIGAADSNQVGQEKIGGSFGALSVMFSSTASNSQKAAAGIQAAAAVYQGAIAVWDATASHATTAGNALAGMAAGAQAGAAFGPWGMAIGAAAGLVIGIIRGKPDWAKAADEVGRDFGVKISDALAKEIAKVAKEEFGGSRQAASIYMLSDIIKEAGGISEQNLPLMMSRLHDVFSMIETNQFTIAEGAKVIDENWQSFVTAATDGNGRISASLKEIIRLNEEFGTQSKEIAAWQAGQGATALQGFVAVAGGLTEQAKLYAKIKEEVDAATKSGKGLTEVLVKQFNAGQAAKQELGDLGIQAIASFSAAVASGMSMHDAIRMIHPALDTLKKAYSDLGLNVDNVALRNLMLVDTVVTNNPTLIAAIGGLSAQMVALDNLGLLNIETFEAMERTAKTLFDRLLAAAIEATGGYDKVTGKVIDLDSAQRLALGQMQDYLHRAAEQAELLGIPLDENTQHMIDQSKELGIWQEVGEDAMSTLIDAVNRLVDALTGNLVPAITDKLGGAVENIPDNPFSNWIIPENDYSGYGGGSNYTPTDFNEKYNNYGPIDWDNPGVKAFLDGNPGDTGRAERIWAEEGWGGFMADGGSGIVDRPTVFVAGEAGREEFAFSGAGKSFKSGSLGNNDELLDTMKRIEYLLQNQGSGPKTLVIPVSVGGTEFERKVVDISQKAHDQRRITVRADSIRTRG